jgi:hypothetical protein
MSRHDVVRLDPPSTASELHATLDRMLRSGLLKVRPSPVDQGTADARFRQLSDALAARSWDDGH